MALVSARFHSCRALIAPAARVCSTRLAQVSSLIEYRSVHALTASGRAIDGITVPPPAVLFVSEPPLHTPGPTAFPELPSTGSETPIGYDDMDVPRVGMWAMNRNAREPKKVGACER